MKFFVSCAKGLEYLLADELVALGAARATATIAGANAEGTLADAQRAVLWSRLASRVLWPLAEFDCPDEQALYDGAAALPWHEHLREGDTVAVDAHVSGEAITHARFAAQRVKDAVVDVFRAQGLERPSVDVEAPGLRLNLSLRKGRATLSVDLGGGQFLAVEELEAVDHIGAHVGVEQVRIADLGEPEIGDLAARRGRRIDRRGLVDLARLDRVESGQHRMLQDVSFDGLPERVESLAWHEDLRMCQTSGTGGRQLYA